MDYNRTIMTASSDVVAQRRLRLIVITLATIPCYCVGWLALLLAPDSSTATPTPTLIATTPSFFTVTNTLQLPTINLTPIIVTGTATHTSTATMTATSTFTPTLSFTPLQPITNTPSSTFTPTQTPSLTPTLTITQTFIITSTHTPTFTPSPTNAGASITPTPSLTPFPTRTP